MLLWSTPVWVLFINLGQYHRDSRFSSDVTVYIRITSHAEVEKDKHHRKYKFKFFLSDQQH